jgi:polysaccharide biosynthesis/export protein
MQSIDQPVHRDHNANNSPPEVDVIQDRSGHVLQDIPCATEQRRIFRFGPILATGLALTMAGCGNGLLTSHAPPLTVDNQAPRATEDYIIGSGDQLSIFVYRNPDLSEAGVAVRPDGRISTPLIEDIMASGETPTHLAREIEKRLAKYIQEPNVTVIVRGFIGPPDRQVRVIGEASDPIAIPYRDHLTLLDVMIATKGLTKFAAGNRAIIVRVDGSGRQQSIKVRLNDLIKDGDISQNVEMSPGDTLIVPQTWF